LVSLVVCLAFAGVFGWGLLYAFGLFALPYVARLLTVTKSTITPRFFTSAVLRAAPLHRTA
jgi:hypothetical protein